jgi:hypothetical protein
MKRKMIVIGFVLFAGILFAQNKDNLKPCYFRAKQNIGSGIKTDEKYSWFIFVNTENNKDYYLLRCDNLSTKEFSTTVFVAMPLMKSKNIPVFDVNRSITLDEFYEKQKLEILGGLFWIQETKGAPNQGVIFLAAIDFSVHPEKITYYNKLMWELK